MQSPLFISVAGSDWLLQVKVYFLHALRRHLSYALIHDMHPGFSHTAEAI